MPDTHERIVQFYHGGPIYTFDVFYNLYYNYFMSLSYLILNHRHETIYDSLDHHGYNRFGYRDTIVIKHKDNTYEVVRHRDKPMNSITFKNKYEFNKWFFLENL